MRLGTMRKAKIYLGMPLLAPASVTMSLLIISSFFWAVQQSTQIDGVQLVSFFNDITWAAYGGIWLKIIANPYFLASAAFIFACEALWPAKLDQPVFSSAIVVDFTWAVLSIMFVATFVSMYWAFLTNLFDSYIALHIGTLSIDLPFFAELLVAYLMTDLIGWVHHFVRHKVGAFWVFHMIHHSQKQMNLFSNKRVHPVDILVGRSVRFAPMVLFEHCFEIALVYLFFCEIHDRFNHSNIRTNLSVLRYVFVTPQSHRIHHSREPHHFDKNFGVTLSIWDHLFGTQYRNYDEYPETGVPDQNFPNDSDDLNKMPKTMWRQLIYPFKAITSRGERIQRDSTE
jgi:sterol desaturase/sphingolipid hydroxylase (fatty acid hydroxylase superfamily)